MSLIGLLHDELGQLPGVFPVRPLRVRGSGEDLVQDTLVAALSKARNEGLGEVSSLGSWLYGILRHKILDYHRQRLGRSRHVIALESTTSGSGDTASVVHTAGTFTLEDVMTVREVLQRLPPRHWLVLMLNQRAGLTTAERARVVKLSPGRVGAILAEAKDRFRRGIRGEEIG